MTWYIIDRKADEFRMSGFTVNLAVIHCRCLSLFLWLCLGCPLLCLCLLCTWVHFSIYICICCVYAYTWFVDSSVALPVAMFGLSALLSVFAICLGLFFCLCPRLLCVRACTWFVDSSICVCYVCGCTWVVSSSVCVCYPYLYLSCLFIFFHFFIITLNQNIDQGNLRWVRSQSI